ncbi:PTS sugar transporter subunit IIA [Lactobacillus sp.]|uniref:PTS sugar transporter subunit IIA n=1 Tax=Lactobacillus sp. TaxID=1591 RepID=UPI003F0731AC
MLLLPAIFLALSMLMFAKKVILSDQKHAEIVAELEKTWGKQFENDGAETKTDSAKDVKQYLTTPVAGELLPLKDSSDPNFASGKMGRCFAIKPNDGRVYAPFDGEVAASFATRHAIGLKSADGLTILIHIGIDTAKLNGTGFVQYVVQGQKVQKGQELIEFWDPTIKQHGLDDTVLVTVLNSKDFEKLAVTEEYGKTVKAGDPIMKIK